MPVTTPQLTPTAPQPATPHHVTAPRSGPASPERPSRGEVLAETVPLISAPAFFGPPIIFLLAPWLLLVLLLVPPAAVLITLVLVVAVAAGLLTALVALIASPYLLVRHLRARHGVRQRRLASALHLPSAVLRLPRPFLPRASRAPQTTQAKGST